MNRQERRAAEKKRKKNGVTTATENMEPVKGEDNKLRFKVSNPITPENQQKFAQAQALFEEERHNEATILLAEIISEQPDHLTALELMGKICLEKEQHRQAITFFKQVNALAPIFPLAWGPRARAHLEIEEYDDAIECFQQAITLDQSPIHHVGLARCYTHLGMQDEAKEELKKADLKHLTLSSLFYTIEHFAKIESEEDPLFERLIAAETTVLGKNNPIADARYYSLIQKSYDDMKEYDKSFDMAIKAAKKKRETMNYNHERGMIYFDHIKDFFRPSTIEQYEGNGHPSDKPVFIVGMPRSGTTLLEQILHAHEDTEGIGEDGRFSEIARREAYMRPFITEETGQKEEITYPFVARGYAKSPLTDMKAIGQLYIDYLNEKSDKKRVVNKAIGTFYYVGLIHLTMPNARLIDLRRHPLDSCISSFTKMFAEDAQPYSYDLTELGHQYARYVDIMEYWHSVLPGKMLRVTYEDMIEDFENQAKRVIDFLDLPWDENCLQYHRNKSAVRTASITQVRQPIYKSSLQRWKRYEKHLAPLVDALGNAAPEDCRYILDEYPLTS